MKWWQTSFLVISRAFVSQRVVKDFHPSEVWMPSLLSPSKRVVLRFSYSIYFTSSRLLAVLVFSFQFLARISFFNKTYKMCWVRDERDHVDEPARPRIARHNPRPARSSVHRTSEIPTLMGSSGYYRRPFTGYVYRSSQPAVDYRRSSRKVIVVDRR